MFARTESNASRIRNACGPPSWSTMATRASRIFPPNALPRIINCTSGKIIDASISAGERKNLRISRSTMAIIRFINSTSGCSNPRRSWLQPRPLRHDERIGFLKFVAQLSSGVVHEDVVERRVLHRERFHLHFVVHGHFHQFGSGERTVAGEHAEHTGAFMLYRRDVSEPVQALLPVGRSIFKL